MANITISFNDQKLVFDHPVTILEVVGNNKDIVCAYVNGRVRELTYTVDYDATIEALTVKDRDAKWPYESSLRFLVAMAMKNIRPDLEVRFSYNVSRSIFMQILNPGVVASGQMVIDLENEMRRLVSLDLPLIRKIV